MEIIYGINSIRDLLRRHQDGWEKIIIASGRTGSSVKEIIDIAQAEKIPLEFYDRKRLTKMAGTPDHQGVVAFRKSFIYADMDQLIKNRNRQSAFDLILILDSIVDPQNLGSIIRTAYCMGANGVIIPEDRSAQVTAAVNKTSAGSVQHIPIVKVVNLANTIDDLKDKGFWIFGADTRGGQNIKDMDFNCSVVLVLGSEAKGIRPLVKQKCDFLITIPLPGDFDSLNVSVASGIILFEMISRRRRGV